MAKKDDGRRRQHKITNEASKKDEQAVGHSRHEAYCPTCRVYYKSNDNSHAGH